MKLSLINSVFLFAVAALVGAQEECEICGCSFCPPGFMMQNPSGLITITQKLLDDFGDIIVPGPDGDVTLESLLAGFGFNVGSVLPCSLLGSIASRGLIPIESCTDDLRLIPVLRLTCGCPALPDPTADAPTIAPVVALTLVPVPDPTEAPVVGSTSAPISDPTESPVVVPVSAPVPDPTEAPAVAPLPMASSEPATPAVSPTDTPMVSPVAPPPPNAPMMPLPTPVAMPSAVVVPTPIVDKEDIPRHYIDEVYYLSHAVSGSYSANATAPGSSWATVTEISDKVGTAGFMHEYCTRTRPGYWYCSGTYVDLYYEPEHGTRRQFRGNVSFAGWFSDSSMEGRFTITGGTDDFRGARGHVSVCHDGGMSQRELHVWY